ncbi:glutamine amidotransferase [Aliihoeflea sp. PC F10.4]
MTGLTVQAFRHVGFEDLGSFEAPLRSAGYEIEYVEMAERDPASLDPLAPDLLVVLGGPIGVYDHDAYPVIEAERQFIETRLRAGRPTLGICLGAQLIAAALGARVYPGPAKEIGWSTLELTQAGRDHPLAELDGVSVLHWHGDTFDMPEGCEHLASTPICRNQAFSRGRNLLALQFHPEVLGSRFEHWLLGHASELGTSGIDPVKLRKDAHRYAHGLERAGAAMIGNWLAGLAR